MSLVFLFIAQGPWYWHFLPLTMVHTSLLELQEIKWPYIGSWASNQKNKDTFFSSTFKVWESKVSLVLWFVAQEPRYWHFLPLMMVRTPAIKVKINMGFEGTLIHMLEQKQTYPWHPSTPEEQIKHFLKKKVTKRGEWHTLSYAKKEKYK